MTIGALSATTHAHGVARKRAVLGTASRRTVGGSGRAPITSRRESSPKPRMNRMSGGRLGGVVSGPTREFGTCLHDASIQRDPRHQRWHSRLIPPYTVTEIRSCIVLHTVGALCPLFADLSHMRTREWVNHRHLPHILSPTRDPMRGMRYQAFLGARGRWHHSTPMWSTPMIMFPGASSSEPSRRSENSLGRSTFRMHVMPHRSTDSKCDDQPSDRTVTVNLWRKLEGRPVVMSVTSERVQESERDGPREKQEMHWQRPM